MNIKNALELPVLVLNKNWQAIDEKNVRRAFEDMTSGSISIDKDGREVWQVPFRGMDIELAPDGELVYANPVDFEEWMKLPARPGDDYVYTGRQHIRAPTVIISSSYSHAPIKPVKLSPSSIKRRDKQECQYCHKFFPMEELNIDHVVPQFHGGEDSWTNLVASCYKCNSQKGHKHNSEIGYRLKREPREPASMPVTFHYIQAKHPSWVPFLPVQK